MLSLPGWLTFSARFTHISDSDVSPWPYRWSLRPKSKFLASALIPQVLSLGLDALKCLHQPVYCY